MDGSDDVDEGRRDTVEKDGRNVGKEGREGEEGSKQLWRERGEKGRKGGNVSKWRRMGGMSENL